MDSCVRLDKFINSPLHKQYIMTSTLAFDVYGTLIDTSGVFDTLQDMIGEQAIPFMNRWRNKQLEYSFRRGLMDRHTDFSVCTEDALNYCCSSMGIDLTSTQKETLMGEYKVLPAFPDVKQALKQCRSAGHQIYAFSNGSRLAVGLLLDHADIAELFDGVISTEDVQMFKPSPAVYRHFIETSGAKKESAWLISGNTFDVIGAASFGMKTAWVRRSDDITFDPWEYEPTAVIRNLTELQTAISEH